MTTGFLPRHHTLVADTLKKHLDLIKFRTYSLDVTDIAGTMDFTVVVLKRDRSVERGHIICSGAFFLDADTDSRLKEYTQRLAENLNNGDVNVTYRLYSTPASSPQAYHDFIC